MIVCANFEDCAAKTVGGLGFLMKAYFLLPQCCQFLAHGCQNLDIDLKFNMGGRIDTILMRIKICDHPISSLDFGFIGGVPLNLIREFNNNREGGRDQAYEPRVQCSFCLWSY